MKNSCPECGADLAVSSLMGADEGVMDCPSCGMTLFWDKERKSYSRAGKGALLQEATSIDDGKPARSAPWAPRDPDSSKKSNEGDRLQDSAEIAAMPTTPLPKGAGSSYLSPAPGPSPVVSPSAPPPRGIAEPPQGKANLVGQTIGGCEILSWIGRGGMGEVYKARQVSLDRVVAFKVISESVQRDESFFRRFDREAKIIAKLNSNRIVQVHDVGFDQGIRFIVMEFVPGGDLKGKTKQIGQIPYDQALLYIRQAAEGLLAAERKGIVHRDIKPENLMLDENGEVKITDFGLAKATQTDHSLTQMGDYLGTPVYMSPEQAQGKKLDHRSDMFSLGATFFYLLTASPPYTGDSIYEILRKKSEYPHLDPNEGLDQEAVPAGVSAIVRRMTELDLRSRYPSFKSLIDDIDRVKEGKAPRPKPGPWKKIAAVVTLFAFLTAGGIWASNHPREAEDLYHKIVQLFRGNGHDIPDPRINVVRGKVEGVLRPKPTIPGIREAYEVRREVLDASYLNEGTRQELLKALDDKIKGCAEQICEEYGRVIEDAQKRLQDEVTIERLGEALALRGTVKTDVQELAELSALQGKVQALDGVIDSSLVGLPEKYKKKIDAYKTELRQGSFRDSLGTDVRDLSSEVKKETIKLKELLGDWEEKKKLQDKLDLLSGEVDRLVDDAEEAIQIRKNLAAQRIQVSYPFDSLSLELKRYREQFKTKKGNPGKELTDWLVSEEKSRIDGLAGDAEKALNAALAAVEGERKAFQEWRKPLDQESYPARLAEIVKAKANLQEAFPGSADRWEKIVAEARLKEMDADVSLRKAQDSRLKAILDLVKDLEPLFPADGAGTTKEIEGKIGAGIKDAREKLESLRKEKVPELAIEASGVPEKVSAMEGRIMAFAGHGKLFADALDLYRKHRLDALGDAIKKLEGDKIEDPRLADLAALRLAMVSGFNALLTDLDLEKAQSSFERAAQLCGREGLQDLAGYPKSCLEKLKALQTLTIDKMAPVRGGMVRLRDGTRAKVEGFFVDCYEVSAGKFRLFYDKLSNSKDMAKLWPNDQLFKRILNQPPPSMSSRNQKLPIEGVSYYDALAYLSSEGKDLFEHKEWWLAATGPEDAPQLHRQGEVNLSPQSNKEPMPVDEGGTARELLPSVHHLFGNVAEWTKEVEAGKARLVGGRYLERDQEDLILELEKTLVGCGFRGVVRPGKYFSALLPEK